MTDEPTAESARAHAEEAMLEVPRPHAGALPPRLLANTPFLWLVASYGVSQLGFWAFFLGVIGEAGYRFHAGAFEMAILFSAFSFAFIPLTVPFGMAVDRWSPKWLMILGTLVSLAAVGVAVWAPSVGWLYWAFALDGVGAATMIPARGSMTALLVDQAVLVRANGMLNGASMLAVIVGPALAGLLEQGAVFSPSIYWYTMGVVVVGAFLLLLVPDRRPRAVERGGVLTDLAEGFRVSWRQPELRALLVLATFIWFLTTVLVTLEPLFVKDVLHRGLDVLGFLWSAHGVGALVGALAVMRFRRAAGREVLLLGVSLIVAGIGFLTYVGTPLLGIAVAGNVVLGVGFAWFLTLSQALVQRVAEEHLRGRVTGVLGMIQETAGLACALALAAIGGLVTSVQPYLVGSAAVLAVSGLYGVRMGGPLGALRATRRTAAPRPGDAAPGPRGPGMDPGTPAAEG